MNGWTQPVTLAGVIPDIAFMIVVYGSARMLVSALDKARHASGSRGEWANWATWIVAVAAIAALVLLGADVLNSGSSLPNLGG